MLNKNDIKNIELFNQKVERLKKNSFIEKMGTQETHLSITIKNRSLHSVEKCIPDDESIESFVLTLRLFCQNGDGISIRELAGIYAKLPMSNNKKHIFSSLRKSLNDYLDHSDSNIVLEIDSEVFTHREVFDTFLYGDIAHVNKEKRKRYEKWMNLSLIHPMLQSQFLSILENMLQVLIEIQQLNERLLIEDCGKKDS